jgi:hypothetical protein
MQTYGEKKEQLQPIKPVLPGKGRGKTKLKEGC